MSAEPRPQARQAPLRLGRNALDVDSSRPSRYTQFARWIGHRRWFAWIMKHVGFRFDRALYRLSAGRLWLSGPEIPTMLLTTTGRKTGKARTVPLIYLRDGRNLVAACENFGLDKASSWPKNALAHPNVTVQIGRNVKGYRARLATDDEAARNVPLLVDMWPAHDTYRERSGQRYVFVFEPHARGIPGSVNVRSESRRS